MFKVNDKVVVVRVESTKRQRNVKKDGVGDSWIISKPKAVKRKAVIGHLERFYIPVRLPDKRVKKILYEDLTFTKAGVSFSSHLPDWKGIKNGKEVFIPGKPIVVKGKAVLNELYIPVVIDGEACQVLYEQIRFKKETK